MDGRQDGTEDTSYNSLRATGVPTIHHSWCASVLHEWDQRHARLAHVDEKISQKLSSEVPSQKSPRSSSPVHWSCLKLNVQSLDRI